MEETVKIPARSEIAREDTWATEDLFATDELTGLIGAAALMRPSKSVQDMELKSLKKKYKTTSFAAGCSREIIQKGAEMLGWELDALLDKTLCAMRRQEAAIEEQLQKDLGE